LHKILWKSESLTLKHHCNCAPIVINYRKDTTPKYSQDTWNTLELDAAWESGHMWCDDVNKRQQRSENKL